MNIICKVKLLTCDIDQFYTITSIDIWGGRNGFNLTEIYNLRNIICLKAESIHISYKIKFLRNLKRFTNTIQHAFTEDSRPDIIISDLEALDELYSMNISFDFGYFSEYFSPKIINVTVFESIVFPGHHIYNRYI